MRALLHAQRWLLLALAALALVTVAAELDHAHKRSASNAAQVSEWFCSHRGERCGGPSSARIQHRWEQRERGYKTTFALLSAAAVVLLVRTTRRRP